MGWLVGPTSRNPLWNSLLGLHTCRGNWQVRAVLWERDGCFVQATSPVFWATLPLDPFQSAWDGEKSTIWNGEMNRFSLLMMKIVEEFLNEVWMQTCDQTQPLYFPCRKGHYPGLDGDGGSHFSLLRLVFPPTIPTIRYRNPSLVLVKSCEVPSQILYFPYFFIGGMEWNQLRLQRSFLTICFLSLGFPHNGSQWLKNFCPFSRSFSSTMSNAVYASWFPVKIQWHNAATTSKSSVVRCFPTECRHWGKQSDSNYLKMIGWLDLIPQKEQPQIASKSLKQTQKASKSLKQTQKASKSLKQTQKASKSLKQTQKPSKSLKQTQKASKSFKQTQTAPSSGGFVQPRREKRIE